MRKQQAERIDLTGYTHLQIRFLQAAFGKSLHVDGHQSYLECSLQDKADTLKEIDHLMEDDTGSENDQEGIHLSFSPTETAYRSPADSEMVRHIMIAVLSRKIATLYQEKHELEQRLANISAHLGAFSTSHPHAPSSTLMQPKSSPPIPSH